MVRFVLIIIMEPFHTFYFYLNAAVKWIEFLPHVLEVLDTNRSPETTYPDSGSLFCCSYFTGTLYHPHEPILLPSIRNAFILRCLDGIHVDGNDRRMSKMIYK